MLMRVSIGIHGEDVDAAIEVFFINLIYGLCFTSPFFSSQSMIQFKQNL